MDESKGYPKYQYSVFLKNGRDQQFVVRADTHTELQVAITNLLTVIKTVESLHEVSPAISHEMRKDFCEMHQKEMKERTTKNGGRYYDHRKKEVIDGNDVWFACNGHDWKRQD